MKSRMLGRTGLSVAEIGLGTEYLLNTSQENLSAVVHAAVAAGVDYIDFFYAQPEIRDWMGHALQGIRSQVTLAAHFGAAETDGQYRKTNDMAESQAYFDDLLRRLRTDYVDVLFLHNVDKEEDVDLALGPFLDQVRRYRDQGQARYIGFSGHTAAGAIRAVESGAIDVLMYPVHIGEHGDADRDAVLAACCAHDVGVVAMKVFAGGKLIRERAADGFTAVHGLSYALSRHGVATAVPGPANLQELREDLAFIASSPEERDFGKQLAAMDPGDGGPTCVYCNHCLPCPEDIDIGAVSRILDAWEAGHATWATREYAQLAVPPSACIDCGQCAERCPWGVDSPDRMRRAAEALG